MCYKSEPNRHRIEDNRGARHCRVIQRQIQTDKFKGKEQAQHKPREKQIAPYPMMHPAIAHPRQNHEKGECRAQPRHENGLKAPVAELDHNLIEPQHNRKNSQRHSARQIHM